MRCRLSPLILLVAALLTAPLTLAQAPVEPPSDQGRPILSGQGHQLTSSISKAVREKLPTYSPTEVKAPESTPEEASHAVVLPKMIVRGIKPLVFTERELATSPELGALLRKRYPGASVPIKGRLPNYALLILADDERLAYITELNSVVEDLRAVGDIKASKDLKKEISRSFMRRTDWRTESLDRSANNNRR